MARAAEKRHPGSQSRQVTANLKLEAENLLILWPTALSPLIYQLTGWLEVTLGTRKPGQESYQARVDTFNVRGKLMSQAAEGVPDQIYLRLNTAKAIPGELNSSGHGALRVPILISYPRPQREGAKNQGAADVDLLSVPLKTEITFSVAHNHAAHSLAAMGTGELPGLTPMMAALPLFCIFSCFCDDKIYCLTMCLSVKVAADKNGNAVLTAQQVNDVIGRTNAIWGCAGSGQCCIKFLVQEIVTLVQPEVPNPLTDDAWDKLRERSRHPTCYDIYLVRSKLQHDRAGRTAVGSDNDASVVRVLDLPAASGGGLDVDTMSNTLAHELGHAMGLANGSGDDDQGVDAHSSKPGNLMTGKSARGANPEDLNTAQCKEARSSKYLKKTADTCGFGVKEK